MKKIFNIIQKNWIILLILILGLGFRFYRLPDMASYDFDQEYVSTFVLEVVREYPIRFIGQGVSIMGLFMGPFYFYLMTLFYLMFGLNPIGGFVGSVLIGILTVYLYYSFAKEILSSKSAGLIAAFIRSIGYYAISSDWTMVPADSSDILIIFVWYLFYKIWESKKIEIWYVPTLFFTFGMFTSAHPVHFPIIIVFFILLLLWRKKITIINWITASIAGILPVSPILYFDYLRNWTMFKQISTLFLGNNSGVERSLFNIDKMFATLQTAHFQWQQIFTIDRQNQIFSGITLLLFWLWTIWQLKKHQKTTFAFHTTGLVTLTFVVIGYYTVFPTHTPEYYLRSLQAISVLYLGFGFSMFLKYKNIGKIILLGLILLIFGLNLIELNKIWSRPQLMRLSNKQAVVQHIIEQADGKPFQISYVTEIGFQSGFRSLFEIAEIRPGAEGPVYTIVAPATFVSDVNELEFISGGVGVNYPD